MIIRIKNYFARLNIFSGFQFRFMKGKSTSVYLQLSNQTFLNFCTYIHFTYVLYFINVFYKIAQAEICLNTL